MIEPQAARAILAEAFLGGDWSADGLLQRALEVVAEPAPRQSLRALIKLVLGRFPATPPLRRRDLEEVIASSRSFSKATRAQRLRVWRPWLRSPVMTPLAGAPTSWPVPALPTTTELAAWLGLDVDALEWFAGTHGRARRAPPGPLGHYTYSWAGKASGGYRLIEAPKARLKALQRRVLDGILAEVPVHPAAHGFCRGRGVLSHAAPHAGQRLVMALDLRDFFASVRASRVLAIFRTLGYPEATARLLTGLATHTVSALVWASAPPPRDAAEASARFHAGRFFQSPHLPQGAPTSPALANLAAFRLDLRLTALARAADATYTRYADDLAFSGGERFARGAERLFSLAAQIIFEEGFRLNAGKTRLLGQGMRQRLAGVVVNAHPNLARRDFDQLKATLHNCRRDGAQAHDRDGLGAGFRAHLLGRVAWAEQVNPARGGKLRTIFDGIRW
ncbi:MAG: RNA-directed DNA polymerase [Deltaproteobacteria bacterium]|nr:RNA-directed DNA polymerase [Deltaproteobacteria bacterium]